MKMLDKRKILATATASSPVDIELGCGASKRSPHAIGIDRLDHACVDIVGDVLEVLAHFPEGSVRSVTSSHLMEHLPDLTEALACLARVVTDDGAVHITVPHFSNPFYHSDPTHKTPFGLYTMSYLCRDELLRRRVPTYGVDPSFRIASVRLGFKSYRPNYVRHSIKRVVGALVNSTTWLTELYEENLCWIVPAYEISYELRRLPR